VSHPILRRGRGQIAMRGPTPIADRSTKGTFKSESVSPTVSPVAAGQRLSGGCSDIAMSPAEMERRIKALAALERKCATERKMLEEALSATHRRPATLIATAVPPIDRGDAALAARAGAPTVGAPTRAGAAAVRPRALARPKMLLVGAGPGDPGLLTVAAARAIKEADVVLADRLVPQQVLELATGTVQVATKTPGRAHDAQRELDHAGLAALKRGCSVVRLKGGDPFVFGRGGEEARWYSSHGFNVGIIPGVSSSIAAAACAGIPVTTRGVADRFIVATAHGRDDTSPSLPTYAPKCTYVFMMSVGRLGQLTAELIKNSFPQDTAVAVVQSGSTINQKTLRSTIKAVARDAAEAAVASPAVIVVGDVVTCLDEANISPYPLLAM